MYIAMLLFIRITYIQTSSNSLRYVSFLYYYIFYLLYLQSLVGCFWVQQTYLTLSYFD